MVPRRDDTLDLDTRRLIYDLVRTSPGLHLREIRRRSGLSVAAVAYHLRYLEEKELIVSRQEGGFRRYYVEGTLGSKAKRLISLLRQATPRRIAVYLLLHPGCCHAELAQALGLSPSTLSYQMGKLKAEGVVEERFEGRTKSYRIVDGDGVAKVLIAHKSSFLDAVLDGFEEAWSKIHP